MQEFKSSKMFLVKTQNWTKDIFTISKTKNKVPWIYVISDLNGKEVTGSFYEKELQKTNQKR